MNPTHDPTLRSWVESANETNADFPIQNLPFGVFRIKNTAAEPGVGEDPRVGVAIGDHILDVGAARDAGLLSGAGADACVGTTLNPLMALARSDWSQLRAQISKLLSGESRPELLTAMSDVDMLMPMTVGDYTDFYASIHHATNIGSMFRPDNPLLPNYKWIPIGYHGRASSIVESGQPVVRPSGQRKAPDEDAPTFGPSRLLDYELEIGAVVGTGNALGDSIPLSDAEDHLFGLCLLNDWSARDVQGWEYQPLGPFLAKSFVSTISPWIVTNEALEPFRIPAYVRPDGDPQPLPHLYSDENQAQGGYGLTLKVYLRTAAMRERGDDAVMISRGSFADMYWTLAQMIAHHSSNGCNLKPGDMFGSGTISGTEPESRGCLMERTWRGTEPLALPDGDSRKFLQDGDEITMRAYCETEGSVRIGFGECVGVVSPAR